MTTTYDKVPATNPDKVHNNYVTRQKIIRGGVDHDLVHQNTKGDYQDSLITSSGVDVNGPGARGAIPGKAIRTTTWQTIGQGYGLVSARSKAHLRQLIEDSGSTPISNIQVRDDGRYFVYVTDVVTPSLLDEDCAPETPGQQISDLPPLENCDPETPAQEITDLPPLDPSCEESS